MASIEQPGEVPGVNVSGQGIQVGTGNNQYNAWMPKPPLDPAALSGLNPHTAVARLQQLSHDELVDFFARASPEDVSEILEVFFETALSMGIAILADINRRKAAELIRAANADYLDDLPEAAEAIARKAGRLGWAHAGPLNRYPVGYARKYKNGHLFWSQAYGVTMTTGAVDDYWMKSGPGWGFPIEDKEAALTSPPGTEGIRQKFFLSTVYSSGHGIFRIMEEGCYQSEGGSGGWLGFPISERQSNGQFGMRQRFEGGAIYSWIAEEPEGIKSFAVRREVMSVLPDQGWRPTSKESPLVSSLGTPGTVQYFETDSKSEPFTTAVYTSAKNPGPLKIEPEIWDYYSKLGAEKSWLGFPVIQEKSHSWEFLEFEAGRVSWLRVTTVSSSESADHKSSISIHAHPLDPDRLITEGDVRRAVERMEAAAKKDRDRRRTMGDEWNQLR